MASPAVELPSIAETPVEVSPPAQQATSSSPGVADLGADSSFARTASSEGVGNGHAVPAETASSSTNDNDMEETTSSSSKKKDKELKKQEKKDRKEEEKRRKQEEKDRKKEEKMLKRANSESDSVEKDKAKSGRLRLDGLVDKAVRMLYPITREGKKTINASIKDQMIPSALIRSARGLAFLTICKAGCIWGVQGGVGIVIGRQPDGGWSWPCAFQTGGMSCGLQIGLSMIDLMLVINTDQQLKALTSKGMIKLGGDLEISVGPLGRNAQAAVAAGNKGVAGVYAYSFCKGIYAGVTIDGGAMWPWNGENTRFYGKEVTLEDLFHGNVEMEDGPNRELLERFKEVLAKMSELTVSRRRRKRQNAEGSTSSVQDEEFSDEETIPDEVFNYFKERGERDAQQ